MLAISAWTASDRAWPDVCSRRSTNRPTKARDCALFAFRHSVEARVCLGVGCVGPALQGLAAVDQPADAGDMASLVRSQEGDGGGDVCRLADAPQRDAIREALDPAR